MTASSTPTHPHPANRALPAGPAATVTGSAAPTTPPPEPNQQLTGEDRRYGAVTVQAWSGLHPRLARRGHWADHEQAPIVTGTVIRVQVTHLPKPTATATTYPGTNLKMVYSVKDQPDPS